MGRPELPLDPAAGVTQRFAFQLRQLRLAAGNPSYRQMSRSVHYSTATLAAAANGRRMPTLAVALAYVRACAGDEQEWRERWTEANMATEPVEQAAGTSPYLGLTPFGLDDSDRFFGRDTLLTELRAKMTGRRLVAVVGPSGSGKSSLLRAGLLGSVGRRALITPGTDPFAECAVQLARGLRLPAGDLAANLRQAPENLGLALRQASGDEDFVLVVDQFEEIFTLCHDLTAREAFIAALLAVDHPRIRIVLGLRADFYGRCAQHTELLPVLRDGQVLVGAMTTAELREVIIKPATRAGCTVDGALVSRLIGEATSQAGVLPLVSHALLETWHRRRGNALTLAGYEATGGLERAVANTAEQVYVSLEPAQQELLKDLVLRLTALGEGTEDTKRRIARTELDDSEDVDVVLDSMVRARLLTVDTTSVEIAHEALIRAWPRLRRWLDEDREGIGIHRQLTDAARLWETLDRDSGALYRGSRLARAGDATGRLTTSEQHFLDASLAAERREHMRGRWFVAALVVLLAMVTAAGVVVFVQRQDAVEVGAIARSRQLAAEARTLAHHDVPQAIKLSLEAYAAYPTVEARSAVLSLASRRNYQAQLPLARGMVTDVPMSPDNRVLASASEPGTVVLWDVLTRSRMADLQGDFGFVTALAFDPAGTRLAAGTEVGELLLWDVPSRRLLSRATTPDAFFIDLAFSPDGRVIGSSATAKDTTSHLRLWDVDGLAATDLGTATGSRVTIAFAPDGRTLANTGTDVTLRDIASRSVTAHLPSPAGPATAVAYGPTGDLIAVGGRDGGIRLFSAGALVAELRGHSSEIGNLGFGENGTRLYSTDNNGAIVIWDVRRRARIGHLGGGKPEWLTPVSTSHDGRFVVAGDSGVGILLWERTGQPYLGHTGAITGVTYSADGRTLFSTSLDRTLVAWDVGDRVARTVIPDAHSDDPWALGPALSPDGSSLVTVSGPNEVTVWDAATLRSKEKITGLRATAAKAVFHPHRQTLAIMDNGPSIWLWENGSRREIPLPGTPVDLTYSPDGSLLATAFPSGRILLLDGRTHQALTTVDFHSGHISAIGFSPDSSILVSSAHDGTVVAWDTKTWQAKARLVGHRGRVRAVAVSPDQRFLATTGDDETVSLWELASGSRWAVLTGHTELITAVAWSPDSTTLATGSRDNSVTPWLVDVDKARNLLCDSLTRDFPMAATAC